MPVVSPMPELLENRQPVIVTAHSLAIDQAGLVPTVDFNHTAAGGPMAGKKRRMGRPGVPGGGIQIKLRVDSVFVQRIDDWRVKQGSKLSRPRAIELLTRMALEMFAGRGGRPHME